MDADREQEQFRALFSELRRADERRAPGFEHQWQAASATSRASAAHRPAHALAGVRLAAGVLLAVGVGTALLVTHFHQRHALVRRDGPVHPSHSSPDPATAVAWSQAISEWQSPTDFLLDLPDEETQSVPSPVAPKLKLRQGS